VEHRSGAAHVFPSIGAAFTHTMAVRAVGFVLGFANSIVVARALGAEGRGQLSLILTAALFLGLVLGPLAAANTILLGREPAAVRVLAVNSAVGALVAALLCALLLLAAPAPLLELALGTTGLLFAGLLTLLVGFQVLAGALNGLLLGRQEFFFTNYTSLANGGAAFALNVLFLVLLGLHVPGALLALALAWALMIGLSLARLRAYGDWPASPPRFSAARFTDALAVGGRAIAANLPAVLMLRSDVFLVQFYMGTAPVGIYTVGVSVAELVLVVGAALNSIAFAKAASQPGSEGGIARSARFALVIGLAAWAGLLVAAPWFFPFAYGAEFAAAATPAVIVMAGVVAWSFQTPLAGFIVGRASYPRSYIGIVTLGFLVNLGLNVILIPAYGLNGAAAATVAAYVVSAILVLRSFSRLTGLRGGAVLVPTREDVAAVAARLRGRSGGGRRP
jgi:O-antigen/teichoic acid export membrane protein